MVDEAQQEIHKPKAVLEQRLTMVEQRECGAKVESVGLRAVVKSRAERLEVKPGDPHLKCGAATWKFKVNLSSRAEPQEESRG